MIVQYTAAAIVNDLASRAHPAAVYSIPTSANAEDHVSMGANEARHVLDMTHDLAKVIALEIYTAAQALEFRKEMINAARRLASSHGAAELAKKIHAAPLPGDADHAVFMMEVEALRAELAQSVEFTPGKAVSAALAALRGHIAFMRSDRAMDGEVQLMVELVEHGQLLMAARAVL
jgi:histidine ammonia-lyase